MHPRVIARLCSALENLIHVKEKRGENTSQEEARYIAHSKLWGQAIAATPDYLRNLSRRLALVA